MDQAEKQKLRLKSLVIETIKMTRNLPVNYEFKVIKGQLIRSISSSGANYRAACRARSSREFYAKLCIVVEELDESLYWFDLLGALIETQPDSLGSLMDEARELLCIMARSKRTVRRRLSRKH